MNERTYEWMCGWIVRALLLWNARVCPLVCTCSTEYSLFFFIVVVADAVDCESCFSWVFLFIFAFRATIEWAVWVCKTRIHTQHHIYTKWMHTWPHTHSYISLLFPYFLATLENIQSFYATLSPFRCSFSLFVFWRSRKTKTTDQKKKNRKKALSGKYVCYRKIKENTMAI